MSTQQRLSNDVSYPLNRDGNPEFGSVVVTLDHLLMRDDHHVVQKLVYSTESAEESLVALLRYYNEPELITKATTLDLLLQGRHNPHNSIYIYTVPVETVDRKGGLIVQAVMSTPCFSDMIAAPDFGEGSSLLAINKLVISVETVLEGLRKQHGSIPPLNVLQLSREFVRPPEAEPLVDAAAHRGPAQGVGGAIPE